MKRILKYGIRLIVILVIPITVYAAFGIILSILSTRPKLIQCEANNVFYITSNGIHLDIVIPVKNLKPNIISEFDAPSNVQFISFGWGDKKFYIETPTWNDLKLSVALNAALRNSDSAMHITYHFNKKKSWNRIAVCDHQYHQLIKYIMESFKRNKTNQFIKIKAAGYTPFDKFYEANGNFTLINTCNNWVNEGLKQSEIKTSVWSPFDFGVLYHIRNDTLKHSIH